MKHIVYKTIGRRGDAMVAQRRRCAGLGRRPECECRGASGWTSGNANKREDMKIFHLYRMEDETGVSGVGLVAEGVHFSNGKCALTWLTEFSSVAIYDSIDLVDKIHGHNGKTKIIWGGLTGDD